MTTLTPTSAPGSLLLEKKLIAVLVIDSAEDALPYAELGEFKADDPSAWKQAGGVAQPPPIPKASQETLVSSKTVVSALDQQLSGICELDNGPVLAEDRMPTALRYLLGFLVVPIPCLLAGIAVYGPAYDVAAPITRTALLMVFSTVVVFSLLRETVLQRISIDSKVAPRLMIGLVLIIGVPLLMRLIVSNAILPPLQYVLAASLPMVLLVNLHRLTHARRQQRINVLAVFLVGFVAMFIGFCFIGSISLWPLAVAVASMMSLQIVSPLRRVA